MRKGDERIILGIMIQGRVGIFNLIRLGWMMVLILSGMFTKIRLNMAKEDLMKPYITNALVDGKYFLYCQVEGIDRIDIEGNLRNANIIAYAIPQSQTLKCTWELRLYFDNNSIVDFSSACTNVGGWQEIGSLNMRFFNTLECKVDSNPDIYIKSMIEGFNVVSMYRLAYEEENVFAECGLILLIQKGKKLSWPLGFLQDLSRC